jgi:hypothetical protein
MRRDWYSWPLQCSAYLQMKRSMLTHYEQRAIERAREERIALCWSLVAYLAMGSYFAAVLILILEP